MRAMIERPSRPYFRLAFFWKFEADALLAIHHLQYKAEDEGSHTKTCQHDKRSSIVELRRISDTGVRGVKHFADK